MAARLIDHSPFVRGDSHIVGACVPVEFNGFTLAPVIVHTGIGHGLRGIADGDGHGIGMPVPCGIRNVESDRVRSGLRELVYRVHSVKASGNSVLGEGPFVSGNAVIVHGSASVEIHRILLTHRNVGACVRNGGFIIPPDQQ